MSAHKKLLSQKQIDDLFNILQTRFTSHTRRHIGIEWTNVQLKLEANPGKLWSLYEMERTGGEPDVVGFDKNTGEFLFCDCSAESPAGRRSLCFDNAALQARKEHKPAGSAAGMADSMGIELLSEDQYRDLQKVGIFDAKTSSWIQTPADIRKLGGALFADFRFGHVFVYHNGAESYYAARGFRGLLRV